MDKKDSLLVVSDKNPLTRRQQRMWCLSAKLNINWHVSVKRNNAIYFQENVLANSFLFFLFFTLYSQAKNTEFVQESDRFSVTIDCVDDLWHVFSCNHIPMKLLSASLFQNLKKTITRFCALSAIRAFTRLFLTKDYFIFRLYRKCYRMKSVKFHFAIASGLFDPLRLCTFAPRNQATKISNSKKNPHTVLALQTSVWK